MKEYEIYINDSLPDTGIDVRLNKTLTECDVTVFSIPYREYITLENRLEIDAEITRFVKEMCVSVDTAIEIESAIKDALLRASFNAESALELADHIDFSETKYFTADNVVMEINAEADFLILKCVSYIPEESKIELSSEVGFVFAHLRKLYEVDDYALSEIDAMTLEELDIVVLDE